MKKGIIISICLVCLALIGVAFAAGPNGGPWHHMPEKKINYLKSKLTEKLELNETQKTTLDRIVDDMMAERAQMASSHKAFKNGFIDLLAKDSVTPDELKALFETKKPAIEGMIQLASEHIAEFHSILTPQQRTTLIEEIESYKGRGCRFSR